MKLVPLAAYANMSRNTITAIDSQQLSYSSNSWQRHRDFSFDKLSTRAKQMMAQVVRDITWPAQLQDFANTIQKRFTRNIEPTKRMSYTFNFDQANPSLAFASSELLGNTQTNVESQLQGRIEEVLCDNLKRRQTARCFLLQGPPGCGKSSMVEQVCARMALPALKINADYFLSKLVGESGKVLSAVFQIIAALQPITLILDECESMFRTRSDGNADDHRRDLLTQLLPRLGDNNEAVCGLFIVAITNNPEVMDPAIISRFKGNIFDIVVNEETRRAVWKNQLEQCYFMGTDNVAALSRLATLPFQDLRFITTVCSRARALFKASKRSSPLSLQSTSPEGSVAGSTSVDKFSMDIGDVNCIVHHVVETELKGKLTAC